MSNSLHTAPPSRPRRESSHSTLARTRRRALIAFAIASVVAAWPALAPAADTWPSRPVRIIVPFPPGGPADGTARVLAEVMSPSLGQPIVVENKTGGGGVVGITAAAHSNDGHTLLMGSTSMVITPSLQPKLTYDVLRDFDPVGMVSAQPLLIVVPASSPIKSFADLVKTAQAKPGALTAGNSGNGTLSHLATELLASKAGVTLTNVPYRGENQLMPDLLAGTVSMGFINLPITLPFIRDGKLRAIAVATSTPVKALPGVPTLRSLGVDGLEVEGWAALLAARGVPKEGLAKLEKALEEALHTEQVKQRFAAFGVSPVVGGREKLREYLIAEGKRWGEVVKTRGIKVE